MELQLELQLYWCPEAYNCEVVRLVSRLPCSHVYKPENNVIKIKRTFISLPFRETIDQCDSAVKDISYTVIIGVR